MTDADKPTDSACATANFDSVKDRITIRQAYKKLGSKPDSQEHLLSLFMNGDIVAFINLPNGFVGIPKNYWSEQSPQNLGANRVTWRKIAVIEIAPLLIPLIVEARKFILHADFSKSRHSDAGMNFGMRYPELAVWVRSRSQEQLFSILGQTIADELDALLEELARELKHRFIVRLSKYDLVTYVGGESGARARKRGPIPIYLEEAFWLKLIEYIGPVEKMVKSSEIVKNMVAWCDKNNLRHADFEVKFSRTQIQNKIRLVTNKMPRGVHGKSSKTPAK